MRPRRSLILVLVLLFAALNGLWLQQDRLVRDGDEEGHVGAAELFLVDLEGHRPGVALHRALVADMGDYPSVYPAVTGTWWWLVGGGPPERPRVRAVNLGWLLLAGLAVVGIARQSGLPAPWLAGALVLHLPLAVGLARHFMPEGALTGAVALAVAAACWQRARPSPARAVVLGLCLALGLLTKQTFPFYAAVPVAMSVRWRPSLAWAALGLALAVPWWVTNWEHQLAYTTSSAGYRGGAGPFAHLGYYPLALFGPALGPVWCLLALGGAVVGWRRHRGAVLLGLGWLVGGVVLMTAVPKKYDRLLVPLLPGAALLVAAGAAARPRWAPVVLGGVAWTAWLSFEDPDLAQPPSPLVDFEPGCLQVWLRPPEPRALGFEPVVAAAAVAPEGPVLVVDDPSIPCSLQTTFDWAYHLGPHLRRSGQERPVVTEGEGAIRVSFAADAGERPHAVELLDTAYALSW